MSEATDSWRGTVEEWLGTLTCRPSTIDNYRYKLLGLGSLCGIGQLRQLSLLKAAPLMVGHWQPSVCAVCATVLKQFWEYTELPVPKPGWKRFKASLRVGDRRRKPRIIEEAEFAAARSEMGPRLGLLLDLIWETGLRLNEALHLRVTDVGRGRIHIQSHEGPLPWRLKTSAADRWLPTELGDRLIGLAEREYIFVPASRVRLLLAWERGRKGSDAMWPGVHGLLQSACRAAGVEPFPFHWLRHTRLTRWAMQQPIMSPAILQYLAGHENIATTMQVYTHVRVEDALAAGRGT